MTVDGDKNDDVQQAGLSIGMAGPSVSAEGYTFAVTVEIRCFLLDACVLSPNDFVAKFAEIRGFLCGRMR